MLPVCACVCVFVFVCVCACVCVRVCMRIYDQKAAKTLTFYVVPLLRRGTETQTQASQLPPAPAPADARRQDTWDVSSIADEGEEPFSPWRDASESSDRDGEPLRSFVAERAVSPKVASLLAAVFTLDSHNGQRSS